LPRLISQGERLSAMAGVAYVLLIADSAIAAPTLSELLSRLSAVETAYSNVDMEGILTHTPDIRAASPTPDKRTSLRWVQAGERVKCELERNRIRGVMVLHPVTSFSAFQHEEDSEPEVGFLSRDAGDRWDAQKRNIDFDLRFCRAAYCADGGPVRDWLSGLKQVTVGPDPSVPSDALIRGTKLAAPDRESFEVQCEFVLGADVGFAVRRFSCTISDLKGTPRAQDVHCRVRPAGRQTRAPSRRRGLRTFSKEDGGTVRVHR